MRFRVTAFPVFFVAVKHRAIFAVILPAICGGWCFVRPFEGLEDKAGHSMTPTAGDLEVLGPVFQARKLVFGWIFNWHLRPSCPGAPVQGIRQSIAQTFA